MTELDQLVDLHDNGEVKGADGRWFRSWQEGETDEELVASKSIHFSLHGILKLLTGKRLLIIIKRGLVCVI